MLTCPSLRSAPFVNVAGSKRQINLLKYMWLVLGLILAVDVAWMAIGGFGFKWDTIPFEDMIGVAFLLTVSIASAYVRPDFDVFMFTQSLLLIEIGRFIISTSGYLGATLNFPLQDKFLIVVDQAIGFDWHSYFTWVSHHTEIEKYFRLAYISQALESFCMLWALAIVKRPYEQQRFLCAVLIASISTTIIATFLPAAGAYIHYDIHPEAQLLYPAAGRMHEHDFLGLRSGAIHELVYNVQGIITFPSFHVTAASLLIWISRKLKWLFVPSLIFNVVIILSTPVHGGHYAVDAIGGILVALAAIAAANALLPEHGKENSCSQPDEGLSCDTLKVGA